MKELFYGKTVQQCLTAVILANAIIMGIQTFPAVEYTMGGILHFIDDVFLVIFTGEILFRLYFERLAFFRSAWNWFDFVVVTIGYFPQSGAFTVLRLLRVLRLFRLFTMIPQLRILVEAMVKSLSGLGWLVVFALSINYIFAIIAVHLYGKDFPDYFGSLPKSMYTMFELMALAGWHNVARMVAEKHPHYYLFFIPYILGASYIILNLAMGVIVGSMRSAQIESSEKEQKKREEDEKLALDHVLAELTDLRARLDTLQKEKA